MSMVVLNIVLRVRKPWDMDEFERQSAINNVLLWD